MLLTTTEAHMKDLYWALYNIRTFALDVEEFTDLVKKDEHLHRFVAAHFITEQSVREQSAKALSDDAHPEMHNRNVSLSKAFRAAKILARALGVESWTTMSSYALSEDLLCTLNDEYKREKVGGVAKLHASVYTHSKKEHRLNGMTFRQIAEEDPSVTPISDETVSIREWIINHKPNSKLAAYLNATSTDYNAPPTISEQGARLSDALSTATTLLGLKPSGSIWKSMQSLARLFGMKIQKEKCEESSANGSRIQGLFKSATIVFEHADIMGHWLIPDHSQFIPVSQWDAHQAIADYDTAEQMFSAEYERPNVDRAVVGQRVERVVKSALDAFEEDARQKYEESLQRRGDKDKRTRDAKMTWDYLKRMFARGEGDPNNDDVLLLGTDYIVKYGIGRQVGTRPSLQSCCRKFRGALAKVFYHDVDIANCHFVLMLQVAKGHGVDLPTDAHYADPHHRENVLKDVMTFYECGRDSAKQLLLSILNGGGPQAWMVEVKIRGSIATASRSTPRSSAASWESTRRSVTSCSPSTAASWTSSSRRSRRTTSTSKSSATASRSSSR